LSFSQTRKPFPKAWSNIERIIAPVGFDVNISIQAIRHPSL
jgi:hypothetical protein